MAKRPSVKEILEAARRGGPAQPSEGTGGTSEPAPEETAVEAVEAPPAPAPAAARPAAARAAAPPPDVPTPAQLGRPLTLKEKMAAARAGGAVPPGRGGRGRGDGNCRAGQSQARAGQAPVRAAQAESVPGRGPHRHGPRTRRRGRGGLQPPRLLHRQFLRLLDRRRLDHFRRRL